MKLHSRCDLACDHCYIYEHGDTTWQSRPRVVTERVLGQVGGRIAEHAGTHGLHTVHVILHGGEPLLAGPALIGFAAESIRAALPAGCDLDLRIHTNGVLLDRALCDLFVRHGVKVGISLDGDRAANDLHRRYADGRSSHDKVLRAVALLQEPPYRHLFAGLLCTVDVRNDPVAVYEALLALDPPRMDFLLPHATWNRPPLRPEGPGSTPYADWLGAVHDRWAAQGRPVPVRTFDSVRRTLRGLSSLTESLGLEPADLVVIDTDGTIEQADSLRTAFDGAAATGFNVFDHAFDVAARHPGMIDRQLGQDSLSAACRGCPVVRSCGGGLYAHRYSEERGFDNPSVFCADLFAFIGRVAAREDTAAEVAGEQPLLTERQWDELAAGYGGAGTVTALVGAQLDIGRTLLTEVWSRAGLVDRRGAEAAWELLAVLDAEAPDALDTVVAHPYTRAWAARSLAGDGPTTPAALAGLAEIAAAAVVGAGHGAVVDVPLRDGVLRLPGVGRLLFGPGTGSPSGATVTVRATEEGFTASTDELTVRVSWSDPGVREPRWQPVRRVAVGAGWSVALEDTDPYRESHLHPVADRLGDADVAAWTAGLGGAWQLITRALPRYAEGIAHGLAVVTPLRGSTHGRGLSAAARSAFGAVGIARPSATDTLALLLVHEFQHVKLGAVLDLYDLFDPEDRRLYPTAWRADRRPIGALLQGAYAHVAVTEFWRSRLADLRREGGPTEHAEKEVLRWQTGMAEALDTLDASGSLTSLGERFTSGMRSTLAC